MTNPPDLLKAAQALQIAMTGNPPMEYAYADLLNDVADAIAFEVQRMKAVEKLIQAVGEYVAKRDNDEFSQECSENVTQALARCRELGL